MGEILTGGRVFSVVWPALSVSLYISSAAQPGAHASPAPPLPSFPWRPSPDTPAVAAKAHVSTTVCVCVCVCGVKVYMIVSVIYELV